MHLGAGEMVAGVFSLWQVGWYRRIGVPPIPLMGRQYAASGGRSRSE